MTKKSEIVYSGLMTMEQFRPFLMIYCYSTNSDVLESTSLLTSPRDPISKLFELKLTTVETHLDEAFAPGGLLHKLEVRKLLTRTSVSLPRKKRSIATGASDSG